MPLYFSTGCVRQSSRGLWRIFVRSLSHCSVGNADLRSIHVTDSTLSQTFRSRIYIKLAQDG